MKIMITGGKGQLGSDCALVLGETHEISVLDLEEMDITCLSDVNKMIISVMPDIVLNCAAYTQVDNCETEKKLAWEVNVTGPKNLATSVGKYDGRLIHISTDYVFNGEKKVPLAYVEEDEPDPINYYGKTKIESEKAIRNILDKHMIFRTAWLYGIKGNNFLKTILKLALKNPKKEIKVINDQYGAPTWSYKLAQQIESMIDTNHTGIFHATAEGYCTWYELAVCFLEKMKVPHAIIPCNSEEYPTPALRPKNSILENRSLKEKGINRMGHWQNGLDRFVLNFRTRLLNEVMSDG